MKANSVIVALFCGAVLLWGDEARAQTEGRPCAAEPTDELIVFADFITCQIGVLGDSDLFRFQGVTGDVVTIRVTDQAGGSSIPSCNLDLRRPGDLSLVATSVQNTMCEIRTTLDRTGLFTIGVTESGNDTLMTYVLELDRLSPASPVAESINPGNTFLNRTIDPDGDADLFILNGVMGDVVSLTVTDLAGGSSIPSAMLELFRPNGTLVTSHVGNTTAIIGVTLDGTGEFTIRVSESGNDSLMTYHIQYQCLAGSCPTFHRLTVGRSGAGNVTSSPAGINCGTDCTERYFAGTIVTLIATADPGWSFGSWSGDADCADGVVTVTGAITCGANFVMTSPGALPKPSDFDGDGRNDLALYDAGTWQIQNAADRSWGFPSDVPVPGSYTGAGLTNVAVYRPSEGNWYIQGQAPIQWGLPADLPVPADYDGDGRTDIAVWRPATGTWYVQGMAPVQFGLPSDMPVQGDYTGDGRADFAVYRPSEGNWYILGLGVFQFGLLRDVPVPADYNGDGRTDIAVFRPVSGEWFVQHQFTVQWGLPGDLPLGLDVNADGRAELVVYRRQSHTWFVRDPLTGAITTVLQGGSGAVPALMAPWLRPVTSVDMEGDRRTDVTVFRESSGQWLTRLSSTEFGGQLVQQLGASGDIPVPGDYFGTGRTQPASYRPSDGTWRVAGGGIIQWGLPGDQPVPGDYDGDGRTDMAVWRPATGAWYVLNSSTDWQGVQVFFLGTSGDVPVPGDYDGDRRTDLAVFRPSTAVWSIRQSSSNFAAAPIEVQWGLLSDTPVPGDYDGDRRMDVAVYRPATGTWYTLLSTTNFTVFTAVQYGFLDDTPVPGDYDGDGRTDVAVFRASSATWYVGGQLTALQWGLSGDIPLPKVP